MHSILKTVSTPVKWVSRELIHHFLLRFPGGDAQSPVVCTYCPEMCRFACPTAVASANDAVTPCNKMSLLYKEARWSKSMSSQGELWPIYDCTGCGRCTKYCVYGVSVGEKLFEARKQWTWSKAQELLALIQDPEDPVGDLADELGDGVLAETRMQRFIQARVEVLEPRSLFFLQEKGVRATLSWECLFFDPKSQSKENLEIINKIYEKIKVRRWLAHESVWLNRRLGRASEVKFCLNQLQLRGVDIVLPFSSGEDAIDCGGEGAYSKLFPKSAQVMAKDFWDRDRNRADGILCFSARCEAHLTASLGGGVPVLSLAGLWAEFNNQENRREE